MTDQANLGFDYQSMDSQAMAVEPIEPGHFDLARYAALAAEADARYEAFLARPEGIAVWQRVRAGAVYRDACRDRRLSLRLQLGALQRSLSYLTDAPAYLEPWYGIGTTAAVFGAEYQWLEGQAPAVAAQFRSIEQAAELVPLPFENVAILRYTIETIEYFLEQTRGLVPVSWCDLQAPINVATELVDTSAFFAAVVEAPERVREILAAITEQVIAFTQVQSRLIGGALARPGHGFASSRKGTGIGLSTDNLVMLAPRAYERFCLPGTTAIGEAFGGVAVHSCGNWARWLPVVRKIPNLIMVDAAFSAQTDPSPNSPEAFRDALAGSRVIVQARVVGPPETVLDVARRLWAPGMRLIVVTYVQDPAEQHQLYHALHELAA